MQRIRFLIVAISILLAVVGLAGIPEDLLQWRAWLAMIEHESARWLFVIIGMIGLSYAYLYDIPFAKTKEWLKPWRSRKMWAARRSALQNPGGGIHIAKLLSKTKTRTEAEEILDIFIDAPIKTNEGTIYASYAQALVRFGDLVSAGGVLVAADRKEDLEAAMDRFYYPPDDGKTVEEYVAEK